LSKKLCIEKGDRFGRWEIVKEVAPICNKKRRFLVKCTCGSNIERETELSHLTTGKSVSCGCYLIERTKETNTKHGLSKSRLYKCWRSMKERCLCENNKAYKYYGALGIGITEDWLGKNGFINFYIWAMESGYNDTLTIDRINNNGNYEPNNCQWITQSENSIKSNITGTYKYINNENIVLYFSIKTLLSDEKNITRGYIDYWLSKYKKSNQGDLFLRINKEEYISNFKDSLEFQKGFKIEDFY